MTRLFLSILLFCFATATQAKTACGFVTVKGGELWADGQAYYYLGTNLWYGAILGSEGQGGDRKRLRRELDRLKRLGVTNVRCLVGGEGNRRLPDHIEPNLQPRPGEYNDTLLAGLDYLMAELGKRGMRAVLYLHNAWQWSGGYGTYLEWAGEGEAAPASVWNAYTSHHSKFVRSAEARRLALQHTRFIVGRRNSITGRAYKDDPTLMAWEICNEPRPFARDSLTKACYYDWIREQSQAIKQIDPNHLVTTGSEGRISSEADMELFERCHALPSIDYLCIHIWPFTWGWIGRFASPSAEAKRLCEPHAVENGEEAACRESRRYLDEHLTVARRLGKPLVLEEFGYPRDGFEIATGSPTTARDRYFSYVLSLVDSEAGLAGCNFWAWGGLVAPPHPFWQPWDPYTGDPAQEEQGLYSVFATDTSTLSVIRKAARLVQQKNHPRKDKK